MKYVQSQQYKQQNDFNDFVLVFLVLTLNMFYSVSVVDFKQENSRLRAEILLYHSQILKCKWIKKVREK